MTSPYIMYSNSNTLACTMYHNIDTLWLMLEAVVFVLLVIATFILVDM